MTDCRAFEVLDGETRVGYLGEGRGPFISASHSALDHPIWDQARYTSLSFRHERVVDAVLQETEQFDAVVAALEKQGLTLRPVAYANVFQPMGDVPPTSPVRRRDHDRIIGEEP